MKFKSMPKLRDSGTTRFANICILIYLRVNVRCQEFKVEHLKGSSSIIGEPDQIREVDNS